MNRKHAFSRRRSADSSILAACLICLLTSLSFHGARADVSHAQADALLAEAARLAPAAQAVEMNVSAVSPAQYSTLGNWSAVIPWTPHIPVSAALLPDGRLLTFASNQRTTFPDGPQFTYASVWDPATGQFTEINNGRHDMFCGGLSLQQDGRLLVNGGNGINGTTALASLFDWRTNEWIPAQNMADGRWYNTSIALPNGEVMTASGNGGGNGNGTIEQWTASSGWRRMSSINWAAVTNPPIANAIETNWHPFFLIAPDGRVLHFGPHQAHDWITATGTGSMTSAGSSNPGTHYPKQGAWAMYAPGKVLVTGGLQAIDNGTVVNKAFTVDFNGATPAVASTNPMANARSFANSVILPNGEVMIVGGNSSGQFFSDVGAILAPEVWNPATGQWRAVAELTVPRNYHSLAMLLPDGRVWSGGGGLSGDPNTDHQDAQVFTPPQLFNADGTPATRPQITAVPDRIGPGTVFTVNATPGVQYFSFIRMSSLTHSVSTDLRHLRFTHTSPSSGVYSVTAPPSINVMTPGYWMMFAVDANGVWSVSRIVQVTNDSVPVVTNPGQQSVMQGAVVSLQINASAPAGGTLSYSASGLPSGLGINASTGLISGTVSAAPGTYRSTILVSASGQVASVSFNWIVLLPNLGTGQITREWWTGISGTTVASLTGNAAYPANPNGRDMLGLFETPTDWDDNMGQRVRGFLTVPATGQYRFAIASDDQSSLRLSTDANPANAVEIAIQPDWTPPQTWTWYSQQQSSLITLNGGTRYYIEAVMKEGNGGDNLAVGWQKPGDSAVSVIAGTYLSPYLPANNPAVAWSFDETSWNGTNGEVKSNASGLFAIHGTASGGANTTASNPALSGNPGTGNSGVFNGTSTSVVMPYNAALNPNDFTIAAWVRHDAALGTGRCILASRDESTSTKKGYGLWTTAAGQWQFRTGADTSALNAGSVTVGQWTHVAASFQTTSVSGSTRTGVRSLFINGFLVAQDTNTYVVNTAKPLVVGAADSPGTSFFAGAIDEVALHQAPLSQPDVLAQHDLRHATSTVPQNQPPQITNPGTQNTSVGAVVSLPISANDAENNPITYGATGLPTGLSISANSGVISGTANTAGGFTPTVSASDGVNPPSTVTFAWNVSTGLTLQTITSPPKAVGTSVSYAAVASNGVNPRFQWNFGDGTATTAWSTSTNATHTFANPGRYLVTLTGTDDTGRTVTSTFYQGVFAPLTAKKPSISASIAYEHPASGNDRIWCVNTDNNSVTAFDVVTSARYAEIATGNAPHALGFAPDGKLWVVNTDSATISVVSTTNRSVSRTISLARGSRPHGIAFDPAGTAAWVAMEGMGRVVKLNLSNGSQLASIDVGGPVRHLSISADSSRIYATRFVTPRVPGEETAAPVLTGSGGQVVVISTSSLAVERTILLGPSTAVDTSTSARGLPNYLGAAVISPDGLSAWIPSKQDNIQRGLLRDGLHLNHENSIRAIASRINLSTQAEEPSSRIDFDNAGMPSAGAFDPWGIYVFTVLEASRDVVIVDAWSRREFLRFPAGRAPQGVVASPDGNTLFVHNFMDRSISVFNVSGILQGGSATPATLATLNAVTTEKLTTQVLQGKKLFYDALDPRLALQGYMSCASCHNDGGHDGRVWDLTGFGEGLRNTITLKGHANHGPLHWTGNFDEVQDFEGQIRNLAEGTGLISGGTPNPPLDAANAGRSVDLDALAAYVRSLTANGNSPNRTRSGGLTTDATTGQQIFRAQNCAACHSGTNFTNSALNAFADIGTIKPTSGKRLGAPLTGFDVPTLRGVWATGPYLHDGSAATLADAIAAHHGVSVSAADMPKLVAFVSSIDDAPASAPLPFAVVLSTANSNVTGPFSVSAIFNSSATGFTIGDVMASNGTVSNFSGSGAAYTFTITPGAQGVVTVSIPANAATDSTGLGNTASNLLSVNYGSADTTPPSVALSASATAVSSSFVVNATFSESVTGLLASEFAVTNGAVTALSSAGAVWSATITPASTGNVTVSLPAGAAQDAAGNPNTASNMVTVLYSPPVASNGLSADYYVGKNFDQFGFTRVDPAIDFSWGGGSPDPRIPVDGFSVRWRGYVVPRYSESYDFVTMTDDGVRLWVNGQLLVNNWTDHGETWDTGTITLQAGVPVAITLEFYESGGDAMCRLVWESASQAREVVPQSQLQVNQTTTTTTAPTGSNPSIFATIATADSDGDGTNDLIERALGTSTTSGITAPGKGFQLISRDQNGINATLLRPSTQNGLALALESTTDLVNWTLMPVSPVVENLNNGWERITWHNLQAVVGQSIARGIVRLRVTQNNASSATSMPQAWQLAPLRTGTQSFGLNLTLASLYSGSVSAHSGASLVLNEQSALPAAISPLLDCYLEIISGPQTGHRVDVMSISAASCLIRVDSPNNTLDVTKVDLSGARVVLRPHRTLGEVFDPALFKGATTPAAADQVLFYAPEGYHNCWLYANGSERRWVLNGDNTLTGIDDTIIPPGIGLLLQIADTSPAPLLTLGAVRTTPFALPLTAGYHLMANPWPLDLTPEQAGMTDSGVFVATTAFSSSDQLQIWSGDANRAATGYLGYWFFQRPGSFAPIWVSVADAALLSQNNATLLKAGRATFVKARPKTGRPVWIIAPPR
ncbi:MAG: PA14 domain-containing protein [Verrucomicrobiaceae bacterium]